MTPSGLDPDRRLALTYVPAVRRPGLETLWHLDVALGAILAGSREPMISRIKLVWWRDALAALDHGAPPAEPLLQAAASQLLPAGIAGAELAAMEEGWACLLEGGTLGEAELDLYARERGGRLFSMSARLLGTAPDDGVRQAGERWALVDLARHSAATADIEAALAAARRRRQQPHLWPAPLRPLGMLAALAERDAEEHRTRWEEKGSPARMIRMMRHRLTGR